MWRVVLLLLLWPAVVPANRGPPVEFDCGMRSLAYQYALRLQPDRAPLRSVWDALELGVKCHQKPPPPSIRKMSITIPAPFEGVKYYVDSTNGSDKNPGTLTSPVRTLHAGVSLVRAARRVQTLGRLVPGTIFLRGGTYYLGTTLDLDPEDSNLTITAYKEEQVWISGGILLSSLQWKAVNIKNGMNVWVASTAGYPIDTIPGLRFNGSRVVRARHPNADPERMGRHTNPTGWFLAAEDWLPPTGPVPPLERVVVSDPNRNSTQQDWQYYTMGIGGECNRFTPHESLFCADGNPARAVPRGLRYNTSTPLPPSGSTDDWNKSVVHAFIAPHWSTWMFRVDHHSTVDHTFQWSYGGFQEATGTIHGAEWYVENARSLLDHPNEYYHDSDRQLLYVFPNTTTTGPPPSNTVVVATYLKELIRLSGTQADPVQGISVVGVGFRDAAHTFLDPHSVPSGGDWALQSSAALYAQGTIDLHIVGCRFERVDGNAVMLQGYHRGTELRNNEMVWIGDTAIAAWGTTVGIDGTPGDQPWGVLVEGNLIHEVGIFEKQSSMWFQAKSANTTLRNNIFMNGPRACINVNDGFGGGTTITTNLIFNCVRETKDHGPFNSWDRQPFLYTRGTEVTLVPLPNEIHHNFVISGWTANWVIDNDDGSSYYRTHHNFLVYTNGHKSDGSGHDKWHYNNIDAYVGLCVCHCDNKPYLAGHEDRVFNNTCIQLDNEPFGNLGACKVATPHVGTPLLHDNHIYLPSGNATLACGSTVMTLAQWQSIGGSPGTVMGVTPPIQTTLKWASELLGIH